MLGVLFNAHFAFALPQELPLVQDARRHLPSVSNLLILGLHSCARSAAMAPSGLELGDMLLYDVDIVGMSESICQLSRVGRECSQ